LHRAARRQALHPVTRAQIDARFAIWGNRCAFCGADATHQRNHGRQRLTVEHVLALTKGGLDEASNIIPACTACNSSKNNSPIEDWYRQQEWFTETRWAKIRKHCPAAVVGQLPLALAA
jgi:5-methylcytosine-specific restriction endonuclease McrA